MCVSSECVELAVFFLYVVFFMLWWNTNQKQLGEGKDVWLTGFCPSSGKARTRTWGRNWNGDHGGMLFTYWLGSSFFQLPSYPVQTDLRGWGGVVPLTVGWNLFHQLVMKKMPPRHAHRPVPWRQFLSQGVLHWQLKANYGSGCQARGGKLLPHELSLLLFLFWDRISHHILVWP